MPEQELESGPESPRISFGKLFKQWREDHEYTQQQIAGATHYDQKMISRYENELAFPSGDFFAHLSKNFAVSDEEITLWIKYIATDTAAKLVVDYHRKLKNLG